MMQIRTCLLSLLLIFPLALAAQPVNPAPAPLKVGVSIGIMSITPQNMRYARSVGISSLQVSLNQLVDKSGHLKYSDSEIISQVRKVRRATDSAGIKVWAFHMPFGRYVDLSLTDQTARERVVALHKKLLDLCGSLKPRIVLFHPSWYLSLNQRSLHIDRLLQSARELLPAVQRTGATMVIENITGPELYVVRGGVKYERPLCRTVPEMMKIMDRMPAEIGGAVDMNHILHPEKMVLALGSRLKFIHVADGDGAHEYHYLPCNGKGEDNWVAILSALQQVGYKGPFMFECHYKDMRQLPACYHELYERFIEAKYPRAAMSRPRE